MPEKADELHAQHLRGLIRTYCTGLQRQEVLVCRGWWVSKWGDAAGVLRGFGGLLEQEMLGMGLHEGA